MTSLRFMYPTRLVQLLPETKVLISVCGASTANMQCFSNGPYSQLKDSVLLNLITLLERLVYH